MTDHAYSEQASRAARWIPAFAGMTPVGSVSGRTGLTSRPLVFTPAHASRYSEKSPMPAYQYIYVMKGLSKTYPGGREVLRDIWLSFLPGAKIGVLGLNGAGKSTLLRVM